MKSPEEVFLQWVYDRIKFDHESGVKLFDQRRFAAICGIMHGTAVLEYRKQQADYEKNGKPAWGWRMHQQFEYFKNHAMAEGWSIEMVRQWIANFFEPRRMSRYSNQAEVLQAISTKVNILISRLKEEKSGHPTAS